MRSVGVEEELLLVDPETGESRAVSSAVLAVPAEGGEREEVFEKELHCEQLEFATRPRFAMSDLGEEIRRWRAEAGRRAEEVGAAAVALATSPLTVSPSIDSGERHRWIEKQFGMPVQEQLTCGCHVHVSVESDEEGVQVLDRIRPWLPVLTALSSNSPFWQGADTGYSSYRNRVWGRWPSAGPVELFGSAEGYHRQVSDLLETGVLRDKGMVYFDARLSHTYPTVEIRVADVCLDASTTVLLATLVRGLVETAARAHRAGEPPAAHGVGALRLAAWRAARSGLTDRLVHPETLRPQPAAEVLEALFAHVGPALEDYGDAEDARRGLTGLLATGTGAEVQRALLKRTGSLRRTVADCVRRSAS
ncbi:glutamate--cysteine ligase [Streptomyces sp. NPDC054863]